MEYKVGDKVRIKSIDWYNSNKNNFGDINCKGEYAFILDMSEYCGKILTIKEIFEIEYDGMIYYHMNNNNYYWTEEMIECLVDDNEVESEPDVSDEPDKMVSINKICDFLNKELYTSFDFFGNVEISSKEPIDKKEFIKRLREYVNV